MKKRKGREAKDVFMTLALTALRRDAGLSRINLHVLEAPTLGIVLLPIAQIFL